MQIFNDIRSIAEKRARKVQPEGLWKRYLAGIILVMVLLGTTHQTNTSIMKQGHVDAQTIDMAGKMRMLTQRTLLLASEFINQPDPTVVPTDLIDTIDLMQATHDALTGAPNLPPALQAAYFQDPLYVDMRVEQFLAAGRDLIERQRSGAAVGPQLATMMALGRDDLLRDLNTVVGLYVDTSRGAIGALRHAQTLMLLCAALVVVMLTILIYLPAHLSVTSTIRDLRQSAQRLRMNQKKLRHSNTALHRAATHDALTDLPNRAYLADQIARELRFGDPDFHIIHLDIDRFKAFNDAAGQESGDDLLLRVRDTLLGMADPGDCVARTGGDEFMILTRHPPAQFAAAIGTTFEDPILIAGRNYQISLSIGYAAATADRSNALEVISNAELALKSAKTGVRGSVMAYSTTLREARARNEELAAELPIALRKGEIVPYFQPQISMSDLSLVGVEVLARWQHPTKGVIAPDVFLPLATAEGLSRELDQVIWTGAMRQMQTWMRAGHDVPRLSLNAAPDTIADPQIVNRLMVDMTAYGLRPEHIVIEVLETTFIGSVYDAAAINIDRLIGAGIMVELDDFGTGYASLSKLIQLSLSGFKLDRSLISPLPAQDAQSIVRAMMAMANEMAMHVVAEGIESEAHAACLQGMGCDIGQGFGIGRPMPAEGFLDWMQTQGAQLSGNSASSKLRA